MAGENQAQSAPQVRGKDGDHGNPDHPAVEHMAGAFKQTQVTDQEGNLEETDAHLVDGSAGKVGAGVLDQAVFRA